MTNRELIDKIIDIYKDAATSKFPSDNIVRTKKHTSSSIVEDLIAYLLSELTTSRIIIDKSFSIQLDGKRKSLQPDIAIKAGDKITHFFDVKMDLGWKRYEFPDYCMVKSKMIKQVRNQKVSYYEHTLQIADDIKYEIIVISDKNISAEKLSENLKLIKDADISNEVDIYFLTSKVHPNALEGASFAKENIVINDSEINRMKDRVQ